MSSTLSTFHRGESLACARPNANRSYFRGAERSASTRYPYPCAIPRHVVWTADFSYGVRTPLSDRDRRLRFSRHNPKAKPIVPGFVHDSCFPSAGGQRSRRPEDFLGFRGHSRSVTMETRTLHSENFDLCRICLLEPESNRNMTFFRIFGEDDHSVLIRQKITELLHVKIESNDVKPKIICNSCRNSILTWSEMKKKAAEAQIVVNYIAKKRFGLVTPNQLTSNDTGSLPDLRNNTVSTTGLNFETAPKVPHNSVTGLVSQFNSYTGSNQQDRSFNQTFPAASHSTPVSTPDYDVASCHEVPIDNDVICVSSDSEDYEDNFKQNPSDNDVVRYCSICKAKKKYDHDCAAYNTNFCTCMVPNCNILFRNMRDFDPHYRQHIGFPPGEWICRRCFKENKKTERDTHGRHICRATDIMFKCYTCNITLDNMAEFASHKLKKHNGRLINSNGNYLCFYCEKSSSDLMYLEEHTKKVHYKKNQSCEENAAEQEPPKVSETVVTTNDKIVPKKRINHGVKIESGPNYSYKLLLFTCLKPSCNLVFQYFQNFKHHHRQHFNTGDSVMCWQCCSPFSTVTALRLHQVKDDCRTPGMFQCHECPEVFDDIQCLSIHKFTIHNGQLLIPKKGQKNIICPSCKLSIKINNFRGHLIHCYTPANESAKKSKSVIFSTPKIVLKQPSMSSSSKCGICGKVCQTAAALSSHIKVHNPDRAKTVVKKKVNSKTLGFGFVETNKEIDLNVDDLTFKPKSKVNKLDYNQFPFINGIYHCIKCPRKFSSRMGLAKHWPFCKIKKTIKLAPTNSKNSLANPKKNLPKNYYCTDCKEYFTRVSFGSHFPIKHGKKLGLNKTKRFSCTKCPFKFLYKVALLMHYQHLHGESDNSVQNATTSVNSSLNFHNVSINLPVISEATSLAANYSGTSVNKTEDTCDRQIKEEINNTMTSDVQWEDDEMDSFTGGQDDCLDDSKINKKMMINDDNVDPSVTGSAEVTNDSEMAEEQFEDSGNAMEVDTITEIEKTNGLEENIESHDLDKNDEVSLLEKNNVSKKDIKADELSKNGKTNELSEYNKANELSKNSEETNELNKTSKETNELSKTCEANSRKKSDNMEVTTTVDDKINNFVAVKKEFVLDKCNESVNEVNDTRNVANKSNSVDQVDNTVRNSKDHLGTNGSSDN